MAQNIFPFLDFYHTEINDCFSEDSISWQLGHLDTLQQLDFLRLSAPLEFLAVLARTFLGLLARVKLFVCGASKRYLFNEFTFCQYFLMQG